MMALTREPRELVRPCDKCAELHNPSVMRGLEGSVCGWAYRSTSWKTRQEAERIAQLLELLTTAKLLSVGAGTGRPGPPSGRGLGHVPGTQAVVRVSFGPMLKRRARTPSQKFGGNSRR
jgi:hypothetical protein